MDAGLDRWTWPTFSERHCTSWVERHVSGELHGSIQGCSRSGSSCFRNGYTYIKRQCSRPLACKLSSIRTSQFCCGSSLVLQDADLKRCFGVNKKIVDCDWKYLRTLTSKRAPGEPPACLGELLEWLIQPDQDHLWLLLDIKMDNNPSKVMQLIARTIASVAPRTRSWSDRIVLGVWTAHFVPFCPQYLPGFPITHIGVSTKYAQQFFEVPNCSFNMLQTSLVAPLGSRFLRKVKAAQRELYAWTVNEQNMMKWCIQKELDGVITDNPQLFREVCHDWRDDEPPAKPTLIQWVMTFCVYFFSSILIFVASRKHPANMHEYMAEHQPGKSRTNKVS